MEKITTVQEYEPLKITKDQDHEEPVAKIAKAQEYANAALFSNLSPDGKQEKYPERTDESVEADERYANIPEQKGKFEDTPQ